MTANPITHVSLKDMSMFMPNPPSFLDWAVSAPNDHLAASADCLIFWCFCPLCQLHCCWIHYMIAWTTSFLYWIGWSQVCMTTTLAFRLFSYCFCNASKNVIICFVQHCFLFYGVAISLGVGSERSFYIKDARHFYIPLKLHRHFLPFFMFSHKVLHLFCTFFCQWLTVLLQKELHIDTWSTFEKIADTCTL